MTSPKILWSPSAGDLKSSQMAQYQSWLKCHGGPDPKTYAELHSWSVSHIEDFWESIWKWGDVRSHAPYTRVLSSQAMPGAKWFEGSKLNFSENLLRHALTPDGKTRPALKAFSECRPPIRWTYEDLRKEVARVAGALKGLGVVSGDRVAAVVSNIPEALVGMLATTSLGAIWSSCSPDFGAQGILDRFSQIQPKVLIAVDGYRYGGKAFDLTERMATVVDRISSIEAVVWISQLGSVSPKMKKPLLNWSELSSSEELTFESVPFDHPVYILYSSGTTGAPKCIVHGGGGTLLQHIKELRLHSDISETDRFFYFTTCGWMMWNWLVSGLVTGAELILFDGSPSFPTLDRLWELIEEERITVFGTSAKFLSSCRSAGLSLKKKHSLSSLRTILSTGSPLLPEDFDWVSSQVPARVRLSSISGGTDIVSCFVLGNPTLPVVRGEIQCKGLGMAVAAVDEQGREVTNQKGELVCTKPAPSMPVAFWNDPDGSKYRKAYFDVYPGVWRHGDFVEFNDRGGCVMYGRSDATLNPGGVRIGTAEIYRQVETLPVIRDSLVVGRQVSGDEEIVLFVVMDAGLPLDETLKEEIRQKIKEGTTQRHVPRHIFAIEQVPYTLSGKKVEMAVAQLLRGETVKNRDALANPESLDQFLHLKWN